MVETDALKRFLVGDLVEVRMREPGLKGSWHPAKVVEVLKGKRRVEYEELLDDDGKTMLRELIPVGRASDGNNVMGTLPLKSPPKKTRPVLRPRPPAHPDSQPISWQEGVWVECFFEDAWWEGILAENITTVNTVVDVAEITRKPEVDVLFPEENDVSKTRVDVMRIGQEWDEETGKWSLKGCAPFPVLGPNKKGRSKKNSRQGQINSEKQQQETREAHDPVQSQETDAVAATNSIKAEAAKVVTESEFCEDRLALTIFDPIPDFVKAKPYRATPYDCKGSGYEERLRMFHLGGGKSQVYVDVGVKDPVNTCPATEEPTLAENERDVNATGDAAVPMEQVGLQSPRSPVGSNVNRAAQKEEAAETFLKSIGWTITKHQHKKTGEVILKCKSPRVSGAAVKTCSSLREALRFEVHRGLPGDGGGDELTSISQSFADKKDDALGSSANIGTGEDDENDEYAFAIRQILKRSGWDVLNGPRTGSDGNRSCFYRTPEVGGQPTKCFKSWRLASEEYVQQMKMAPKEGASVPNQKKRGSREQVSSPVSTPRRVSRRRSMHDDAKSTPEDAKKSVDGSDPSIVKSKAVPNSALRPEAFFSSRDHSDVDDYGTREVNVLVNSGRKRTAVDLGQDFARSTSTSSLINSYLTKPFGSVYSFTENDSTYVLHVVTYDFLKEQLSVTVENYDMLIKGRYVVEEQSNNIPVRYNGSLSARVTLPRSVERENIAAELKSPFLIFTLPKSLTVPKDPLEIKIR